MNIYNSLTCLKELDSLKLSQELFELIVELLILDDIQFIQNSANGLGFLYEVLRGTDYVSYEAYNDCHKHDELLDDLFSRHFMSTEENFLDFLDTHESLFLNLYDATGKKYLVYFYDAFNRFFKPLELPCA